MKIVIGIIIGLLVAGGAWFFFFGSQPVPPAPTPAVEPTTPEPVAEPEPAAATPQNQFGFSVESRPLEFFEFGTGETELILIGGIHGGYEWNTVTLAQEFIEYFETNPTAIPVDMKVTVIPVANPDGLHEVVAVQEDNSFTADLIAANTEPGRFNANNVDLNRNFDCKWQATSTWRTNIVSAGTGPFSEPEAAALRDLILDRQPAFTVVLHSASNGIYSSYCEDGALPQTETLGIAYSEASGYPWNESFDYYIVTGDIADWMASVGLPAISVELTTHEAVEWEKNLAGVEAVFDLLSTVDTTTSADDVPIVVTDFSSCVAVTGIVMESYPRQCAHEGVTYVEEL